MRKSDKANIFDGAMMFLALLLWAVGLVFVISALTSCESVDECGNSGDRRCNGDVIEECVSGNWTDAIDCSDVHVLFDDAKFECCEIDGNPQCVERCK